MFLGYQGKSLVHLKIFDSIYGVCVPVGSVEIQMDGSFNLVWVIIDTHS